MIWLHVFTLVNALILCYMLTVLASKSRCLCDKYKKHWYSYYICHMSPFLWDLSIPRSSVPHSWFQRIYRKIISWAEPWKQGSAADRGDLTIPKSPLQKEDFQHLILFFDHVPYDAEHDAQFCSILLLLDYAYTFMTTPWFQLNRIGLIYKGMRSRGTASLYSLTCTVYCITIGRTIDY